MLISLLLAASMHDAATTYAAPEYWALDMAAAPRLGFVADVDGDGRADLIAVSPQGDCSIAVSLTIDGVKPGSPQNAIEHWGKNCEAAAVGKFDSSPGADVVGIFSGTELRLASGFKDGHFKDTSRWVVLPSALNAPALATVDGGKTLIAYSTKNGAAFRIDSTSKQATPCRVPSGMVWIGDEGDQLVGQDGGGHLSWIDKTTLARKGSLGQEPKTWRPAAAPGRVAFGGRLWTAAGIQDLAPEKLPKANETYAFGPLTGDEQDLIDFRDGTEMHSAHSIMLRRNAATQVDSSNDGLPDTWKLNGFRGLDMKALGCKPGSADVLCLVSRFDKVSETRLKSEMDRVIKFYANLKVKNRDGTTGIRFHPIYIDPISGADTSKPWWENEAKFRPEKWRGVVHWMQVTPGGGGQANELSDGGTCGEGALWAVFVHEFGHQLGLNHEGFWPNGSCPIYSSLMNYNYSYSYMNSRDLIHYSDGSLDKIVLREDDLDEVLPYPYEKVKFLEQAPYHYRLKANGNTTLIDWNWDGIFGEHHVKANINYAYSIGGGERHPNGKTDTAPWLFTHNGSAYVLYGVHTGTFPPKTTPTLGPDQPGQLILRRQRKQNDWEKPWTLDSGGLIGDPVAASFGGSIYAFYQTQGGVMMRKIQPGKTDLTMSEPAVISDDKTLVPTVGVYDNHLYLFLWNATNGSESYKVMNPRGQFDKDYTLDATSTSPVGLCTDTVTGDAVVGLAQDQDAARKRRWQIRRYRAVDGKLTAKGGPEWVSGEKGGDSGIGRVTMLFEKSRDTGPKGRVYMFYLGPHDAKNPACEYVASQIADKTVHGGWLVKRYYDEWTQSDSPCAAIWWGGDIMYAFRWGDTLNVAYQGSGINDLPFGDHDDLTFIREFGAFNSLVWLSKG